MLGGSWGDFQGKAIGLAKGDYGRGGQFEREGGEESRDRFVLANQLGNGLSRYRACYSLYVSTGDARITVSGKRYLEN